MYIYGFTTFAGIDKVLKIDSPNFSFSVGDLLQSDDDYFLVLGNSVSFAEQYTIFFPKDRKLHMVYEGFFSQKYVNFVHWMVAEYYSTYKNVMKYFVSQDIESLLKKETHKKIPGLKSIHLDPKLFGIESLSEKGQTLIVYPDLWTMYMMTDISLLTLPGVLFLHSSDTQVKKDKAFWQIKHGLVKYILVTHAELFQDFHALHHITLVHPYKRYYANQQDPRYKTPDVLKYLADFGKTTFVQDS